MDWLIVYAPIRLVSFDRMFSSAQPLIARDPTIQPDIDATGVNGVLLKSELEALTPQPPLAWSEGTASVAATHNTEMIAAGQQFHTNSLERRQRLLDAGVNLQFANGELISSENVFGFGRSPFHIYAAYIIDWGPGQPDGMQPNRPHRAAIMQPVYEEIGHAITQISASNFGPLVNTMVMVNIENPPTHVTGAVFQDDNASGYYENGEGLGGIRLEFTDGTQVFTTTTTSAGAYQL